MTTKQIITKIGLILVPVLVVGFLGICFYFGNFTERNISSNVENAIVLVKPAFAQSLDTAPTFLDDEAGISLYVNVGQSLDLTVAKTVFRTVEKENADYVVGSVAIPNLSENEDVHCFVHKDGWIVTYYLKGEPISKVVDWGRWSQSESRLTENNLQAGLKQMTNALGKVVTDVKYYHFQYPNASKCMIIIETLVGNGEDSFNVTIPNDLNVYERSWSHYSQDIRQYYGDHHTYFRIDSSPINSVNNTALPVTVRGTLVVGNLIPGVAHVVSVASDSGYGSYIYGVCIALTYQEPL